MADGDRRVVVSLAGIDPDTSAPGGWLFWAVGAAGIGVLLLTGPPALHSALFGTPRPGRLVTWVIVALGALLAVAAPLQRRRLHRTRRIEIDRAAGTVRLRSEGLWIRQDAVMALADIADLALMEDERDDARVWRLEFRPRPRSRAAPLTVMETHNLHRLEPVARRIAREAGIGLVALAAERRHAGSPEPRRLPRR